jgi:hypothetical protein
MLRSDHNVVLASRLPGDRAVDPEAILSGCQRRNLFTNKGRVHRARECGSVLGPVNALRVLSLRFDRAFRAAFGR